MTLFVASSHADGSVIERLKGLESGLTLSWKDGISRISVKNFFRDTQQLF
jgi:hypothetical protein